MRVLLIDNDSVLLQKLEALIPGKEIVRAWDDLSSVDANDFDLIVLSGGSRFGVMDGETRLKSEIELIKNSKKPIIGICFGCELIVHAFGGVLEKMKTTEKGIIKIKAIKNDPIFSGIKEFEVYEHHRWHISKMPKDFIILAESANSIEAIKHNTLPIYGLQFHPENFRDKTDGDKIFMNIFNLSTK